MDKILYFIEDVDEEEDADIWEPGGDFELKEIAEDIADYVWDHREGWEWMYGDDCTVVLLVGEEKQPHRFKITVEARPVFSASEVK